MKHSILLVLSSIFLLQMTKAQQPKNLTLDEAVKLSLAYSKQLKLNETKILTAANAVKEAKERKLPDANVTGAYLYLPVKPNIDLKTSSNNNNGGTTTSSPNVNQAIYGMANISLPLYAGGKINYGIESAKYLEQAVKLDADNDKEAFTMNVINACISLYKTYQAIDLVKENLKTSEQRVIDFTNLEKNGILARNDLLKAQLQSSNIELALLDAESNYKIASVTMNLLMGLPEETELIPDRAGLALPTAIQTLEDYEKDALQNRKDIAALSFRKKAATVGVKNAKADYYPNVALTGGYVAADIPKFLTVTNAVNIGIGVKYNLSSLWKTKTKIEQANNQVQQLQLSEELLNDNIKLQINQAFQTYLVATKKIEVYEKAVTQATENYRITKNKNDNSLATTTELLDADVALLQTKLSVTNAKADAFLAYNKLLLASGILKY